MSIFKVEKRRVLEVRHHPNADKLDICKIAGTEYQFINERDSLNVGDWVVYFPEDSLIPENVLDLIGLKGKLHGSNKNRCKAIQLRGETSQGLLIPFNKIEEYLNRDISDNADLTVLLGVEKYEPPLTFSDDAIRHALIKEVIEYDIENAENFTDAVEYLMGKYVYITEKLEGTNFSIYYNKEEDKVCINSHRTTMYENPESKKINRYLSTAKELNLTEKIKDLCGRFKFNNCVIYGELIGPGIEGNIYGLTKYDIRCFDMLVDRQFVDADTRFYVLCEVGIPIVPILWLGTLKDLLERENKTLVELCHGTSQLNPKTLREGIIITPQVEERYERLGRLVLKQKDPIYLARKK